MKRIAQQMKQKSLFSFFSSAASPTAASAPSASPSAPSAASPSAQTKTAHGTGKKRRVLLDLSSDSELQENLSTPSLKERSVRPTIKLTSKQARIPITLVEKDALPVNPSPAITSLEEQQSLDDTLSPESLKRKIRAPEMYS